MSRVTNIVLSVYGGDVNLMDQVNSFIGDGKGFVSVDDEALPKGWYGGTKYLEADLYIGAFNYLDLPAFLEHLRSLPWSEPRSVQLFLRDQDDERFSLINLME
jgi:hypothetical protein